MVSQYGIKLAAYLISSSYSDFCSKVCECLLSSGTLTLVQIIPFSIRQEVAFGEASKIVTKYTALFDNMIHKMRFPKFMQIVSEELGEDCLGFLRDCFNMEGFHLIR
ncbi:Hypothetical predicted protein [Olea europaea subsp. europaea]|uniref:DNA-directed RNA polymerase III subunit RPC3 n=1 Tax=Olea europaea subsp. europaea TaxID=158383 RepID=A0A8S0RBU7_OLEEU|nr:Hypothetical predicted protein [Olea europaea subsp. europaea]